MNAAMHRHCKSLLEEFMEEDKLKQLFHSWDTQNDWKGFNNLISKSLLKDQTICKTIENSLGISLTLCLLLGIGYKKMRKPIFALTRLTISEFSNLCVWVKDKTAPMETQAPKKGQSRSIE
jgi:hypothetical protein